MTTKNLAKSIETIQTEPTQSTIFGLSVTQFNESDYELVTYRQMQCVPNKSGKQRAANDKEHMEEHTKNSSLSRARKNIRHKIMAIGADRMLTLTYRDAMTDTDKLWSDFRKLIRHLKTIKKSFHYVAVPELHKSGGLHLHIALKGFIDIKVIRNWWYLLTTRSDGKTGGQVNITSGNYKNKKSSFKIATYVGKYLTKAQDFIEISKNRYRCSLGIKIEKLSLFIKGNGQPKGDTKKYVIDAIQDYLGLEIQSDVEYHHNLFWLTTYDAGIKTTFSGFMKMDEEYIGVPLDQVGESQAA